MTTKDLQPGIPELIRNTFKKASAPGPEQQEAIDLLKGFGFDPTVSAAQLSDEYILAVLDRSATTRTH